MKILLADAWFFISRGPISSRQREVSDLSVLLLYLLFLQGGGAIHYCKQQKGQVYTLLFTIETMKAPVSNN